MTEAPSPQAQLWQLQKGALATQALHVAAHFGIADRLAAGPRPVAELAREVAADEDALYRFLRALATEGVFDEGSPRTFRNTPASELLRANGDERWREFALQFGSEWYRALGESLHAATTGTETFTHVFGCGFTEWLQRNPDRLELFSRSMEGGTAERAEPLLQLPWDDELVVDVGGGTGGLLVELLRRHANLRGIVYDLPEVVPDARARVAQAGLDDRIEVVGGSFFDAVPDGGNVYVLARILHGCDDAAAAVILRNVHEAAADGARLAILDAVLPPGNAQHGNKWLDLLMLVLSGGRERTADEWRALLAGAGFAVERLDEELITTVGA